jgi:mono/diheme cytochrome c family protein
MKTNITGMKTFYKITIPIILMVVLFLSSGAAYISGWEAPAAADNLSNPYKGNDIAIGKGKTIYAKYCVICHGAKGKGDGMGGMSINPRPANFTTSNIQTQTDGAIYWKLTTGRAPMPGYSSVLSAEERWQVVNYIRTFKK